MILVELVLLVLLALDSAGIMPFFSRLHKALALSVHGGWLIKKQKDRVITRKKHDQNQGMFRLDTSLVVQRGMQFLDILTSKSSLQIGVALAQHFRHRSLNPPLWYFWTIPEHKTTEKHGILCDSHLSHTYAYVNVSLGISSSVTSSGLPATFHKSDSWLPNFLRLYNRNDYQPVTLVTSLLSAAGGRFGAPTPQAPRTNTTPWGAERWRCPRRCWWRRGSNGWLVNV